MKFSKHIKASRYVSIAASASAVFLLVLSFLALNPITDQAKGASAATGTAMASTTNLVLSTINDAASVNIMYNNANGTFASSDTTSTLSFTASTNNYAGYTLSILADDDNGTLATAVEPGNTPYTISSISAATSATDFSSNSATGANYNNQWGILPSTYVDAASNTIVDNTGVDKVYLPSPTTIPTILNRTTTANTIENETVNADTYTLGLGIRVDGDTRAGTYTKDVTITALANPTPYTIDYNENTEDTVTNMPSSTTDFSSGTTIEISDLVPERFLYTFLGWCSTTTTPNGDADTCSGTIYNPNGDGTNLTYGIDQTTTNTITLYAMWEKKPLLQEVTTATCPTTSTLYYDSRDGTAYRIQKLLDGKCWLQDNLSLDLTDDAVKARLSSENTNASETSLSHLKGASTRDPSTDPSGQYATAGVSDSWSTNSYSAPLIFTGIKNTVIGDGKAGMLYNFCAASAGSYCYGDGDNSGTSVGDSTEDICPKGWRMPTGNGEFENLNQQYNDAGLDLRTGIHAVYSGLYISGHGELQGYRSYFWLATRFNDTHALFAGSQPGVDHPGISVGGTGRTMGMAVRCKLDRSVPITATKTNGASGIVVDGVTYMDGTIKLEPGTYTISGTYDSGYEFASWAVSGGVSVASTSSASTTMTVTGAGTLTLNGKSKLFFQDATSAQCGQTMYDNRGTDAYKNIAYTTASINGLCWMTRNLDLPGGTTLTPSDSNVASNYTLPASKTSTDGGVTLDGGFNNNAVAYVYNSGSTTCGDSSPCYSYYSYAAATADTNPNSGNATSDICPKGWRLPTQAEFATLKNTYTTGPALTVAPWYGVYSGGYSIGSFYYGGSRGLYWSSTAYDASYAYFLAFDSSDADVDNGSKFGGLSIRCIADRSVPVTLTMSSGASGIVIDGATYTGDSVRLDAGTYTISGAYSSGYEFDSWAVSGGVSVASTSSASTTLTVTSAGTLTLNGKQSCTTTVSGNMQDFKPCSSIANGTSGTLTDSRGGSSKSYTVAKIDGLWWMTTNLDLPGGTTLTSSDSNVASNYTLPASSTSGFSDNTTAYVYSSNSTTCGDGSPCYGYYSYAAATAGTNPSSGNAQYDICPKGWRLPTQAEFTALTTTYTTGDALTAAPFNGVYAGEYGRDFSGGGSVSVYWSSTADGASFAYNLYLSGFFAFVNGSSKMIGGSVRCVTP